MFSLARRVCLVMLCVGIGADNGHALTYLDANDNAAWFKRIYNDSIPFIKGERIVVERKGVVSPWVVALIRLSYEDARREIEQSVQTTFGIEEARETCSKAEEFKGIDPNVPEDPLFGEGFAGFRQLVHDMRTTCEYIIVSKEFNHAPKVGGYSVSKWRLGDGREILGQPWSILVVERTDFSREWARDHTGIPWPFKISGITRLVTETEISLIDDLIKQRKGASIEYFIPYPAYKTGAVFELMKAILEKANAK